VCEWNGEIAFSIGLIHFVAIGIQQHRAWKTHLQLAFIILHRPQHCQ